MITGISAVYAKVAKCSVHRTSFQRACHFNFQCFSKIFQRLKNSSNPQLRSAYIFRISLGTKVG